MKMIVETTGPHMLMGSLMNGADAVPHDRPAVVLATTYIQLKAAAGALKILKQDLPDAAEDAEFAKYLAEAEGDVELAVESYISSIPSEDEAPKPETAKQRKAREAAEAAEAAKTEAGATE